MVRKSKYIFLTATRISPNQTQTEESHYYDKQTQQLAFFDYS